MASGKKKKKHVLLKTLLGLILLIGLVLLGGRLYFRLPVRDYYAASERAFTIPGLSEGFVPQGLARDEAHGVYLVGGYMKGGGASPVYTVRADGSAAKTALLRDDGTAFTGHAGGLAVTGNEVLVAAGDGLWRYSLDDILSGGEATALGKLQTHLAEEDALGVAFVCAEDSTVTVGEFYRDPQYPTAETHKFTAPSGERLQALAVRYLYHDGVLTPMEAYALPDLVQGLTFHDGKIWLSTSWGTAFSGIASYDTECLTQMGTISVDGTAVPLYPLDSAARDSLYRIPPMSEEIIFVDGRLLVMCESASQKYWFGLLTGGQFCYATDLTKLTPQ